MEPLTGHPHTVARGRPGPIATVLGAIIMVVLLVTLFVFVLPLALILIASLILIGLVIRAKKALDNLGRKRVPRHDRDGRRNVRVVDR